MSFPEQLKKSVKEGQRVYRFYRNELKMYTRIGGLLVEIPLVVSPDHDKRNEERNRRY